jgi:hypothetical protein
MKQKYLRLEIVKVIETSCPVTRLYLAIIDATYSQLYCGKDIESYRVYVLDDDLNIVNRRSWIKEYEIYRIKDQPLKAEEIEERIEEFNFNH